jgi:hypothetical protein
MDWGALVKVTLQLYLRSLQEAWQKVLQGWWLLLLPVLYSPVLSLATLFAAPLGLIGGFLIGLTMAACVSSYLYFIGEVVGGRRIVWQDLGESFRVHLGSVISVLFILMLLQWVLALALPPVPSAQAVRAVINLGLLVILNPAPEIIYQTRAHSVGIFNESWEFLRENWAEWFAPFVALATLFFFLLPLPILLAPLMLGRLLSILSWNALPVLFGSLSTLVVMLCSFFLFLLFMIFRGILFRELSSSTRRQRLFRARFE